MTDNAAISTLSPQAYPKQRQNVSNARSGEPQSEAFKPTNKESLLGQVLTPPALAKQMVQELLSEKAGPSAILDPCVGPGTFPLAMFSSRLLTSEDRIDAIDLDPEMIERCNPLSKYAFMKFEAADFLTRTPRSYDFVIMNPPYVRQEWLSQKKLYNKSAELTFGAKMPATANLYVYFIIKAFSELKVGGKYSILVYDTIRYTRYGSILLKKLSAASRFCKINPVPATPFQNALIDAVVISGTKAAEWDSVVMPEPTVEMAPEKDGWIPLESLFQARRGLRLKQAGFFLLPPSATNVPSGSTKFIKKIGRVDGYLATPAAADFALLAKSANEVPEVEAELGRRLKQALADPDRWPAILNWHAQRPEDWFLHRAPPSARIIFNYYVRGEPRHILNRVGPYSDNFYGIDWTFDASEYAVLAFMNSRLVRRALSRAARNQGSGLVKLQLFEYRNTMLPNLAMAEGRVVDLLDEAGRQLVADGKSTIARLDRLVDEYFQVGDQAWVG